MHKPVICLFLLLAMQMSLESLALGQTVMMVGDSYTSSASVRVTFLPDTNSLKRPTRPTTALKIFRYLFTRYPVINSAEGPRYEVKSSWGGYIGIPYVLTENEALVRLRAYYNHPFPGLRSADIGSLLDLLKPETEKKVSGVSKIEPANKPSAMPLYRVQVDVQTSAIPDPPAWGYLSPDSIKQSRAMNSDLEQPQAVSRKTALAGSGNHQPILRPESMVAMVHSPAIPFMSERLGTAWCLDAQCSVLVTNYHVARFVGKKLSIKGERVVKTWMATGPHDADARPVPLFNESYSLNQVRDLALLKVEKPLSRKGMRNVPLYLGELQHNEPVTVYSYPNGKLTVTTGRFRSVTRTGVLEFDLDSTLAPGCSGGLIVDARNEGVGVLFALAINGRAAFAVPVWSLARFINSADPKLYSDLFPVTPYRPDTSEEVRGTSGVPNPKFVGLSFEENAGEYAIAGFVTGAATGVSRTAATGK